MGQQQLLLLVLSTVIVGLATVAGIQAFDEGQSQAANDALTQRAVSIASDIQAQASKPDQLGGIDHTLGDGETVTSVANAIGFENETGIEAGGAGEDAECEIVGSSTTGGNVGVQCAGGNAETSVTAEVVETDSIATSFGSVATLESLISALSAMAPRGPLPSGPLFYD
jgi:hypothetical protein